MNRSLQFIKKQKGKPSLLYPTSNPVDSTDLKERQTNIGNKETHRKLSLKVDTVRRCPDRKLSVRRMTGIRQGSE